VTNVRINWITVRPNHRSTRKRPARRAGLRLAPMEILEARGLLSVMPPVLSVPFEYPEVSTVAAIVVSSVPLKPADHGTSAETTPVTSKPDDHGHAVKVDDGNPADSTSDDRTNSGSAGAIRRPNSNNASQRELASSLIVEPRNNDFETSESAEDNPLTGPELISGLAGGDVSDTAAAAGFGGLGLDSATSILNSAANPSGRGLGLDGRAAGMTTAPTSAGTIVTGLENSGANGADPQSAPGFSSDGRGGLLMPPAASGFAPGTSAWAVLLDGAIHADWEAVDVDLRQFLARLGGLTDGPDGPRSGPAWSFWIGAATVLLVARRASSGRRRLFRGAGGNDLPGLAHRPIPVGPWPLGSP
jgi:hypothetical protein